MGISKAENNIDLSVLEDCARECLENTSPRLFAVLDPIKVILILILILIMIVILIIILTLILILMLITILTLLKVTIGNWPAGTEEIFTVERHGKVPELFLSFFVSFLPRSLSLSYFLSFFLPYFFFILLS